ncbi:MAG: DMT family transporter [Armatimonadetes bacterium]|nr:DMT family transporter [Armatimonadota bacterium]
MNTTALLLVGASAVLHASWNYLAKRAQDQVSFMFLTMATSAVLLVGPLIWLHVQGAPFSPWIYPVVGGLFQALYCYVMGRGYECGDLSHVYPLARGVAPVLIALLAWPLMHEGLTAVGVAGMALVVVGTLALNSSDAGDLLNGKALQALRTPASRWALLASVTIALYHVIDKAGAQASSPLSYLCVMYICLALFLWPLTRTVRRPEQVWAEWRRNWKSVISVTVLCFVAYFLVVTAMTLTKVAYVAALRNASVLLGVLLGATALRERNVLWRGLGALLMLAGIVAIAVKG